MSLSLIALIAIAITSRTAEAQSFRIVTINTFTGAVTGAGLGGATIALQNESEIDYYPLRFGVGLGTIMGLGTGFYDLSQATGGSGFYVDGFINSAGTSGTIILMDTFYGAATGAIVGTAVSLMTESRIVKGIQFGSGAGAWVGFAFGLVDAFALSSPDSHDSFYDSFSANDPPGTGGLFQIHGNDYNYSIAFINPLIFNTLDTSGNYGLASRDHLGIEFTRINIPL